MHSACSPLADDQTYRTLPLENSRIDTKFSRDISVCCHWRPLVVLRTKPPVGIKTATAIQHPIELQCCFQGFTSHCGPIERKSNAQTTPFSPSRSSDCRHRPHQQTRLYLQIPCRVRLQSGPCANGTVVVNNRDVPGCRFHLQDPLALFSS